VKTAMLALVPAAGVGARAGAPIPKQYWLIRGEPMLCHTLRALAQVSRIDAICVVTAPTDGLAAQYVGAATRSTVAAVGGASRAETVRNGLTVLAASYAEDSWVLVHDAARCCITPRAMNTLIDRCLVDPVGGLLAVPVADTLKAVAEHTGPARVARTVPREGLWQAQTPQMFRLGALRAALAGASLASITDEASAMEAAGHHPLLVMGEAANLKVTLPQDFIMAELILSQRVG
jgi:2-C-methyl-D-erythritol 4-phosphate cytidylyltransferase